MSLHSFDPQVAAKVGVNAAVIYQNFVFWCKKNAANRKHIRDGYVWTYNSRRALSELFPYLTESQIKTSISKLVENGLLIKGEYNSANYDRTNWYSPAVSEMWLQSTGQKSPMDWVESSNGLDTFSQPIPDSNTDSNTDSKQDISPATVFEVYNEIAERTGWPKVQSFSKKRERAAAKRIKECGGFEAWKEAIERAAASDFLTGRATGTTPASFDWLSKQSNFAKLMEGNYDNRTDNQKTSRADAADRERAFAAAAIRTPREDIF